MASLLLVFVAFGFISQIDCSSQYDNYTLIRLHPTSEEHQKSVTQFNDPTGEIEIMKESRGVNDTLDILVPPSRMKFVHEYANTNGLVLEEKQPNYGRTLEDVPDRLPRRRILERFGIFNYNSYDKMQEFIEAKAQKYGALVQLQDLGKSFQGRKMRLVKISTKPSANNPIIFVDAGVHGREWVAPAMALYLIDRLTIDPRAFQRGGELDGVDWYILPLVNPDGYEYTRSSRSNRMWRKTRSKHGSSHCYGVDGNRNYGFKWAVSGVSSDPCHKETYAGPQPFSEPETQMVRNVMMDNAKRMKLYVSLHSYGQYLVYPWGYTGEYLPKQWKKLDNMAKSVSDAVERAGGQPFKVLSAGKWYPAAGGSDDFAFGAAGVPYSYTMELTEGHEFAFPENLLETVLPQFYEGFKEFGARIRAEFGNQRKKREILDTQ
ncbi:carboxypeptidase B-like [Spodoptera litura]|uniref:Carboxypeptidase B-like n=1 Tax=Spodoptera litura TaxID=69820 RepID=A0A9J7EV44_SPOLT|nr:carboxypeptidase B-like [Spodoptera litura]